MTDRVDGHALRAALAAITLSGGEDEALGSSEFLMALAGDMPKLVHHYTSADALHKIVSGKSLRLTHVEYLNDTTELDYGLGLVRSRLHARSEHPRKQFTSTAWTALETTLSPQNRGFDVFVACFSEHEDIIPQWKGYAAAGAGYAIGFDLERTALVTETIPLRVIYGRSEQDAVIDAAIDGYLDVLERSLEAHPGHEERTASAVGFTLVSVLTQLIAGFKDESFAHEREWRLVEFIRSGDKRRQAEIRFEPRRGVVVPFIQRPLGKASSELPIRRVCCGPIAAPEIAARGVTSFLRGAGLSSEVVLSKAPLRF